MICLIPFRVLVNSTKQAQPRPAPAGKGGIGALPEVPSILSVQRPVEILRVALLTGIVLQVLFWMSYSMLAFSPVRYFEPATGVLAIGLIFFGAWIERKWGRWGLTAVGLVLIAWNLMFFFMNDDHNAPFAYDGPQSPLLIYTWYMEPFRNGLTDGYGTPVGFAQWCALVVLLSAGFGCLTISFRQSCKPETPQGFGTRT